MSLTLLLRCNDVAETRSFYPEVLGFKVTDTAEGTLTAESFGGKLIFTASDLWKSSPCCSGTIYSASQTAMDIPLLSSKKPNWSLGADTPIQAMEPNA